MKNDPIVSSHRQISITHDRVIGFTECGPLDGFPVMAFHGLPGSSRAMTTRAFQKAAYATNVRIIAPDRPGYGSSSRQRGHLLKDWPSVICRIADDRQMDQFSVLGWSGGGPYAGACAALLAHRLRRAAIVSGVGPRSETVDALPKLNRLATGLAALPVNLSLPLCAITCLAMRRWPEASVRMATKIVPPCDATVMRRPDVFNDLVEDGRATSKSTPGAMADDYAIYARPWGFRLEDIAVPVDVWHGELDENVPIQHGLDQANRIPGAVFHACAGEGHFLIIDHLTEILAAVVKPFGLSSGGAEPVEEVGSAFDR